ncbi:single-stranded DNA-binding protein [Nocardia tengchongensis]|uniref:Single-stranded DNA-binding protein n=1 Tax=Nocardia tengchongensis TaxID=2055889 RepID=A0ABX8CQI5_9NOCA|nr:single-stranded DNA-binding protein [Nocardia tengchongensis]QVI21308.1 single-stranded DNA-binding protein [Nocardia tengchongensis]
MYEANTAVIGRVVTQPVVRGLQNGEQLLSFRLASTARRYDQAAGDWVDGGTLYLTVSCWRRGIIEGVEASLQRGDPVIAYGQLRSNEYTTRDGAERTDLEMRALAVGPDLGRCTAPVVRKTFARPDRTDPVERPSVDADTAGEPATTHS